ncbi:MAG: FadR/GntR family transcriptional regulator [Thermomicrobiales bacterium]
MSYDVAALYRSANGRRLHERVVQRVARQIVRGELQPGATLPPEAELALRFDVSRTVVREAARILVAKGLVTVKHGRGMTVQPPDRWDYLDPLVLFEQVRGGRGQDLLNELLEVRRLLEGEAAALAAQRRTDQDVDALRQMLAEMDATLDDPDRFTRVDIAFHDAIMAAAQNRLLREALRPVAGILTVGRTLTSRVLPGAPERSQQGHQEILAAIVAGDPEVARLSMRRHILQFEDNIRSVLQQDGPPELEPLIDALADGV